MLESLEHRLTPAIQAWALLADPEGDVYYDLNGNGTRETNDELTVGEGWRVYADANENGVMDVGFETDTSDTTGVDGHYNLLLPEGTHSIRVVPQPPFQDDRLPFGTVVSDFASVESGQNGNFSGLTWVNDSLYVTFTRSTGITTDNVMYQVDPKSGAPLGQEVSIPGEVGEITFDGTDFWGADPWHDVIIRFNFAGEELQRLSFAGVDINSVEWDGSALRVLDNPARKIYTINPAGNGTILGSINTPNESVRGLAFDGAGLWVNSLDTNRVYGLDAATGAVQRSFAAPGIYAYGLSVHGTDLWLSDSALSRVFNYDLGYGGGRIVTVAGAPVVGVDLAVFQLGSISGRVFNDNDNSPDGIQDANDGGLAGWRVYVESNANGRYDPWETSAVTDALGNYTLNDLRPGQTTVALDLAGQRQPRWSQVVPTTGTHTVALNSGEAISGKTFANFLDRTTPIAANQWGSFQGGEMSLYNGLAWYYYSGQEYVEPNFDAANALVANSTHGGYTDWRLPTKIEAQTAAGSGVEARLYLASGGFLYWTSTTSTRQRVWAVALNDASGYSREISQASHAPLAEVRDTGKVIDDGAAGYTATGFSAKSTSGAYQGDQSTAASSGSPKTATWTFTGLEPGATYKVDVTWKPVSGATSNAPFTIVSGASSSTTFINQSVAPNDFTVGTTSWKGLGAYTISGNTLTVQLNQAAAGTVIADAVRIFKVLPSYAPAAPLAAASLPAGAPSTTTITAQDVQPLLTEALRRWRLAGADVSNLGPINIQIADLGGNLLGTASGNTITLDDNAAGWDWFIDRTPRSNSEFHRKGDQGEQGKMDLLTVLSHEVGHILGRDHVDGAVMSETLAAGTRESLVPEIQGRPAAKRGPVGKAGWFLSSRQR